MAVTKQQKGEILAELTEKFKRAQSIGFASSSTMTVAEFGELRNSLRGVDASYNLAKKTLIVKAVKEALNIDIDLSLLEGQIWVVCSYSDAVSGLGKVNDFITKTKGKKINWSASIFEWEFKNLEDTKEIAGMPSRETLLGRLVGSMQSPLSALARFLDAAAKEVESTGKSKVGELDVKTTEEVPATAIEEKVEEVAAEEPKAEIKSEEAIVEEKTETTEETK